MRHIWLFAFLLACGRSDQARPVGGVHASGSAAKPTSMLDVEVHRALVLDAALKKTQKELAALEATSSPDASQVAQKKKIIEALTGTLAETERRINLLDGSNREMQ